MKVIMSIGRHSIHDIRAAVSLPSTTQSKVKTFVITMLSAAFVTLFLVLSVKYEKKENLLQPVNTPLIIAKSAKAEDNTRSLSSNAFKVTKSQDMTNFLFEPKLRPFSSDILSGYKNCSTLLEDIEEVAKYLVNDIVNTEIKYNSTRYIYASGDMSATYRRSSGPPTDGQKAPSKNQVDAESSFEANNQVEDVDEADIIKSDGTNVFLAYGNDLVWMRTNGTIVQRFSIPKINYVVPKIDHWNMSNINDETFIPKRSYRPWRPSSYQHIAGLLLNQNNTELVVIVSHFDSDNNFKFVSGAMTSSQIYTISGDTLTLKEQLTHLGKYQTSRLIDNKAHVVTMTYIENRNHLRDALRISTFPRWMNEQQYRQAAYNRALLIIPMYAKQLLAELIANNENDLVTSNSCRDIVSISDMLTGNADTADIKGRGIMDGFARTVSFHTTADTASLSSPRIAGAFFPTKSLDIYASKDYLVLAGRGSLRIPETFSFLDYTYLLQFQLDRDSAAATATPVAIGKVPGYFLNQFSIDQYQEHLRIATTTRAVWGYNEHTGWYGELVPSSSRITILKRKGSMLENTSILTDLGVRERIYSVRFFQEKAFVVTFRRIDPFFTIDLSDPQTPFVAGELKVPGFSSYLHLIENNQYVLAVGRDADETTGRITGGLQISLFDVTNFTDPKQIHKKIVEGWNDSDALKDHLAFRYFAHTLILPVEYSTRYEAYDGFYSFNVSVENGITAQGTVTHATADFMGYGCWSKTSVPARSMVFKGDLMTVKGHVVKMSDGLVYPKEVWSVNLDENRTHASRCYRWFGGWVF
eukprot:CAMPEP_0172482624 /NCGR_PEP_ID=MMETSP1066-20121228/9124_1 /TAXON_ID=671091 /ORGANISM="Coscinodiscus wailesii, Strain CCMP2513" /LENGTH=809 /DNA_ID=CAMNT_0013245885 /DNA_START=34 /DNA_END=2463 /DNA_ORIENTATION=-